MGAPRASKTPTKTPSTPAKGKSPAPPKTPGSGKRGGGRKSAGKQPTSATKKTPKRAPSPPDNEAGGDSSPSVSTPGGGRGRKAKIRTGGRKAPKRAANALVVKKHVVDTHTRSNKRSEHYNKQQQQHRQQQSEPSRFPSNDSVVVGADIFFANVPGLRPPSLSTTTDTMWAGSTMPSSATDNLVSTALFSPCIAPEKCFTVHMLQSLGPDHTATDERSLSLQMFQLVKQFADLIAMEWEVVPGNNRHGVGDYVLQCKSCKSHIVVEVKHIFLTSINAIVRERLTKVHSQSIKYFNAWATTVPKAELAPCVYGGMFTNYGFALTRQLIKSKLPLEMQFYD